MNVKESGIKIKKRYAVWKHFSIYELPNVATTANALIHGNQLRKQKADKSHHIFNPFIPDEYDMNNQDPNIKKQNKL